MKLYEYEKVVMTSDEFDDGSKVINFDVVDDCNIATRYGGYVITRQEDNCHIVTVFNKDGDVLSETVVPFEFSEHEEEN